MRAESYVEVKDVPGPTGLSQLWVRLKPTAARAPEVAHDGRPCPGGRRRAWAYEAGLLVELLPWLEERGERPTVLVGTSVGALTAAFLASVAHLPAREAADQLLAAGAR